MRGFQDTEEYRRAMFLLNGTAMTQYVMSHQSSRLNGALKADMHRRITSNYVATLFGGDPDSAQSLHADAYAAIHDETAERLTNHLAREIGFDPEKFVSEQMIDAFFLRFHAIALEAANRLNNKSAAE